MLKMSVCCSTYNRPDLLGELIASFEMQDYPAKYRELIILDDAGQYGDVKGDGWQIVSFSRRFASLGEKRNACVSLSSPDTDYWVVADDDDIYLPHWLQCHAENFEAGAEWSFGASAYWSKNNRITERWNYQNETFLLHPGHAFSKKLFWRHGGYPHMVGCEDQEFFKRLLQSGTAYRNAPREGQMPFLLYRRFSGEKHMTLQSLDYYRTRKYDLPHAKLEVGWRQNYLEDIENFENSQTSLNADQQFH